MSGGYKILQVTSPVNVLAGCEVIQEKRGATRVVVLMGPIGSGKSSFVQSLAEKDPSQPGGSVLQIAKDQLEGATQELTIYEVINVIPKLYIVDTPGLADEKISELSVVKMLQKFTKSLRAVQLLTFFYFHPINNVRVNRTLQSGLSMFKAGFEYQLFTLEQVTRAENCLTALQEQYWKNTQESTSHILDEVLHSYTKQLWFFVVIFREPAGQTRQGKLLHDSLLQRIESIRQQLLFIDQELASCEPEHEGNNEAGGSNREIENNDTRELEDILISRRRDLTANLEEYQKEMLEFQTRTAKRSAVVKWIYTHLIK